MLTRAPSEGHVALDGDADRVVAEQLDLGRRAVRGLEVAEDDVAQIPACSIEAPDDEAGPDVVVEAAEGSSRSVKASP